jgi:GTP cyclohydrolase I/GTP cyclohydrolase-4
MTACPCAQELVTEAARARGSWNRASPTIEIERVFDSVPVATHNQRGIGSLYVGCPEDCDAE